MMRHHRAFHGRHGHFAFPHGFGSGPMGDDGFGRHGTRGGGRGGSGGGRRRLFDNDALRLILLKLIADEPRHGYELIRAIEALSGETYAPSPGVVYPTLTLLADMELIAEQTPTDTGSGSRKRFAITDAGLAQLAERQAELEAALGRLAALAEKAERMDGGPVRRAMHNLRFALQNRLEKEGADEQTLFDVAALIDEAATKIERL
ncbi:PadR family transcriptional regulator [Sphingobium sp.]